MERNDDDGPTMPPAAYVNFLRATPRGPELFLAFAQLTADEGAKAQLLASLVTTPQHAKVMAQVLMQAVERYEAQHGEIVAPPSRAAEAPPRRKRSA